MEKPEVLGLPAGVAPTACSTEEDDQEPIYLQFFVQPLELKDVFDQLGLSKCPSKDGNVLRGFLPREKLVAFDVEGVSRRRCFSTKVFDGSEWNGLKFKRLEGKRFPAVTKCNVQRSGASNVENVPSGIISKQCNCPTVTWDVLV